MCIACQTLKKLTAGMLVFIRLIYLASKQMQKMVVIVGIGMYHIRMLIPVIIVHLPQVVEVQVR